MAERDRQQAPERRDDAPAPSPAAIRSPLLGLQQRAGNAATIAMLGIQPKLRVGAVDDAAEREADAVAARVLRTLDAGPLTAEPDALARSIRRRPAPTGAAGPEGGAVDAGIEGEIAGARASGKALPEAVRAPMEHAFGADFSGVRVHDDARSDTLNRSLGAEAFTTGADIFFSAGALDTASAGGKGLLAHELAHTVQQGAAVRRRTSAKATKDEFLTAMDNPANRQKLDHIPSTGLGRFDAEYLPRTGELVVTVRVFMDFVQKADKGVTVGGGWDAAEEITFFDDFKKQAEAAWSRKHSMVCTKPGFEGLRADAVIKVAWADRVENAHFNCKIQKEKVTSTGLGREQADQVDGGDRIINVGNFAQKDAPVRAHDSKSTCDGIASHDMGRLTRLIQGHGVNPIRFESSGKTKLAPDSIAALDAFAKAVKETDRPGSVPVPLLVHGKENRRERGGKEDTAQMRADVVNAHLGGKGLKNPIKTGRFTDLVDAAKAELDSKESARGKAAAKEKLDPLKARQNHREAELAVDDGFKWKGDPYSILAHEFGHMLGNPDEYFAYGSKVVQDKKAAQLLASGRPEDAILAAQVQGQTPTGTESHVKTQESYAELAEASGQQIPEFGPKTSSIMSAGDEVLPVHYAPLWEVLGEITAHAIQPEDWKIG